jgi:hypothetical protein
MKKFIIGMFALCLGLGMVSCNKEVNAQDVVAKAKAEGANWDEAQWKDAFKDMLKAAAPMFNYMKDVEKKMKDAESGDDAAKMAAVAEIMKEAEAKQKEFEPLSKAFEEFSNIAEKNPVAKKLMEDKAFEQEMKKEFNLPEEMF